MHRQWGLLGVPSSAGAHTPGLEKGPAALRAAGIAGRLGRAVVDHGDLPPFRWRPDPGSPSGQNLEAVVRVAAATADAVARIDAAGQVPFVLGGDCSITVGVMAGLARAGARPALMYVDGGPDLFTPQTRPNGNFDAMGVAHLLRLPGHAPDLAAVAPRVGPGQVLSFGDALPEGAGDHELELLDQLGIARISAADVHADPQGCADRARGYIEAAADRFLVHFDVDVLRFVTAPLADVPDSGGDPVGLSVAEVATALATFAASQRFAGLVLTEVNPDHVPTPDVLSGFVRDLATALSG